MLRYGRQNFFALSVLAFLQRLIYLWAKNITQSILSIFGLGEYILAAIECNFRTHHCIRNISVCKTQANDPLVVLTLQCEAVSVQLSMIADILICPTHYTCPVNWMCVMVQLRVSRSHSTPVDGHKASLKMENFNFGENWASLTLLVNFADEGRIQKMYDMTWKINM